jgi:hypothetical protein
VPRPARRPAPEPPLRLSHLLPLLWLGLVLWAYWHLALAPFAPDPAEIEAVRLADRWAVPLLALVLLTGIIRYFRGRASEAGPAGERVPPGSAGQDTP